MPIRAHPSVPWSGAGATAGSLPVAGGTAADGTAVPVAAVDGAVVNGTAAWGAAAALGSARIRVAEADGAMAVPVSTRRAETDGAPVSGGTTPVLVRPRGAVAARSTVGDGCPPPTRGLSSS